MGTHEYMRLKQMATELRRGVIKMIGVGKAGHIVGSFSIDDIVAGLYFHKMRHDPKNVE